MTCDSGRCDRPAWFLMQHPPKEARGRYCRRCSEEMQALDGDWVVLDEV